MVTIRLNRAHTRRPIGFGIAGMVLLLAAGVVGFDAWQRQSSKAPASEAYEYTVNQAFNKSATYLPSSFYTDGPAQNTAYVTALTDKVLVEIQYTLAANQTTDLTYVYDAKASIRGTYALQGSEQDTSNVWTKEFQLVAPVKKTEKTNSLVVTTLIEIPYAEYRQMLSEFKTSLALPVNTSIVVTYAMRVSGKYEDAPIDDRRSTTITMSADQQIFTPAIKYDKSETKQVLPEDAKKDRNQLTRVEVVVAIILTVAGLSLIAYGFRRQIFKTPYQREMEKIYRFHDGIIIRASKPVDMKGKHLVTVKSFDDVLNLEEELKLPIVATTLGMEATQFTIIRDDVVYSYTLGTPPRKSQTSLEKIEETVGNRLDVVSDVRPPKKTR